MSGPEEPPEPPQGIRIGRHWFSAEKLIVASIAGVALILLVGFLISSTSNKKDMTTGCEKIASFSLAKNGTKAFAMKDGTPVVVALTSADSIGGYGTLKVGEQTEPFSFYSGTAEDWNGVRIGVISANTSGTRTSLNLVAADCSTPAGTK
jgi:hypothetical protein